MRTERRRPEPDLLIKKVNECVKDSKEVDFMLTEREGGISLGCVSFDAVFVANKWVRSLKYISSLVKSALFTKRNLGASSLID